MKLNYKRTILIGMAFLSICAFWQMYDNIIPLILKDTFHLGETVTGAIMAADNILALFLLPLFGSLSDRTNTRIGKRMPFILAGTVLSVLFLLILPVADQTANLPLFIAALFLVPKPLRSKGNAVINLMGAIGGVYALIMIKFLVGGGLTPDYFPLFLSIGLLMLVCVAVLIFTIRENPLREMIQKEEAAEDAGSDREAVSTGNAAGKSSALPRDVRRSLIFILLSVALWYIAYNAVTTAFSRYATHVWGLENGGYANCLMVATVAAIISYIPIGAISGRIGRKRTILIGVALLTFCYLCASFYMSYHASMNVFFGIIGFAWAAINVNSFPMVVEISANADVGKYTGYYYTFSMAAQVVTPILSGFLLEHISYRTLFPYAVVFSVLAFCTMLMVKHGDSKPVKKKSVLENFDIDD